MIEKEIRLAIERISISQEYLELDGFIYFFEAIKHKSKVRVLFGLLKKRIENEMEKFSCLKDTMDFVRAVHNNLPAFSKFYRLDI